MHIGVLKQKPKPANSNKKYPFDDMDPGDMFEAGPYSVELQRSIYGCIDHYKNKRGNSKKVFSTRKMKNGKLGVWRDK